MIPTAWWHILALMATQAWPTLLRSALIFVGHVDELPVPGMERFNSAICSSTALASACKFFKYSSSQAMRSSLVIKCLWKWKPHPQQCHTPQWPWK